jgi:proteasome assembly chaperone (PAC2) family protein
MSDTVEIWEQPEEDEIYMLVGWRQWADAGSISSNFLQYLIRRTKARQIGIIRSDGFYLFQFPGTHDLIRPAIKFKDGHPKSLKTPRNEIYYAQLGDKGILFLIGDEPHLDVERYVESILTIATSLGARRIIGFGGVYGELPFNKERIVSCIYSLPYLKEEIERLSVNLSDYQGGASIGSYICRRAAEQEIEFVSLYAFVPTYDFSSISEIGNTIRLENDFLAWLGVMRRVSYMLNLDFDLSDLERKSNRMVKMIENKVQELDSIAPHLGVLEYMNQLEEEFTEIIFNPLDDVWEEELRRLFDDSDFDAG